MIMLRNRRSSIWRYYFTIILESHTKKKYLIEKTIQNKVALSEKTNVEKKT